MASQFKTFVSGDVLTAAEVNDYLMKQSVIVCDSSGDYPGSPVEGMSVYDKALDCVLTYDGSSFVRCVPVTSTAVQTWTPVVDQSGNVAATVGTADYVRQGCLVTAWMVLSITGSGTAANQVEVTLPVTGSGLDGDPIGAGHIYDASGVEIYVVSATLTGSGAACAFQADRTGSANWGLSPSVGLANGDVIRAQVTYTV